MTENDTPTASPEPEEAEQAYDGPDTHGELHVTGEGQAAFHIGGDGGMHMTDEDGQVVFEARDPYVAAYDSAPIFTTLLADYAEQWAEAPIPYPDAWHLDVPQHLWNLGGEHHNATFVGGVYAPTLAVEASE